MQSLEHKKSVLISPKVHKKIIALRKGNQTYGDVIAESIQALEEKQNRAKLPCFDDVDLDELDRETQRAEADFEENFVSLEDSVMRYEKEHKTA
ncbi:MAG TPA: hypothetical protein O0X70_05535 [Methanocorpusculum sp.]|nr:hypothetical protein [Methanocorpusculum sp.]